MQTRAGDMYFVRIEDSRTSEPLYEYNSVFSTSKEALQDAEYMIGEGSIPIAEYGYIVRVYDTHPDIPGVRQIASRGIHIKPMEGGG